MITTDMFDGLMAMRPMVPARDFERSRAFYERLGFSAWPIGDGLYHMQIGDRDGLFCFLLQKAYARDWAENMCFVLTVRNLDLWWAHLSGLDLPAEFGTPPPVAPRLEPWGLRVAYLHDPSGVLWHIAEQDGFGEEEG